MSDTLYAVNRVALELFQKNLMGSPGKPGREYFEKRGISEKTIKKFGLGYCSGKGFTIRDALNARGFTDKELVASGLFSENDSGQLWFRFFDRVMYPIKDRDGHVIAFGGRIIVDNPKEAKYKNSPETEIFSKRENLFAQDLAFKSGKDCLIICEGYMDVISMHQAGFNNAVASLGTALTDAQAALMRTMTDKVILLYDTDGPGRNATMRAIPILERAGIKPYIADSLPAKDPDEFIQSYGAAEFKNKLNSAIPVLDYLCMQSTDDQGNIDFVKMLDILIDRYDPVETPQTLLRLERAFQ